MLKKILAVDDEPTNLQILRQILKDEYQLLFAPNGEKGLEAARKHQPDLILLDIMMPGLNGYEVCERLKAESSTKDIPVIFVTAMAEVRDETKGFDVGGVDYIQKPVSAPIVRKRVATHLSLVRAQELEDSQREAIFMLGEAGHYNDEDTGVHIWRMAAYASLLAKVAGWPEDRVQLIELAAAMHDTGKIGIPDAILKAPRPLSPEEWQIMRQHSQIGYDILKQCDTPVFTMAAEIAYFHHEKWDGSGYPNGVAGEDIPEAARIVALVDVFDALTMPRPYKEAWPMAKALEEIERGSGSQFDPKLVPLFVEHFKAICAIQQRWQRKGEESYHSRHAGNVGG